MSNESVSLHPQAQEAFNKLAAELLRQLEVRPAAKTKSPNFQPDIRADAELTASDIIGTIQWYEVDYRGIIVSRYQKTEMGDIGFVEYNRVREFAENIQKAAKRLISREVIEDALLAWAVASRNGETTTPFCDHLLVEMKSLVRPRSLIVPVARLSVEVDFPCARSTIINVTKEACERLIDHCKRGLDQGNMNAETRSRTLESVSRRIYRLQGCAAVRTKCVGDFGRARAVALREAEQALALLRFFCDSSLHPYKDSGCVPLGMEQLYKYQVIEMAADGSAIGDQFSATDLRLEKWDLSSSRIEAIRREGLDQLTRIVRKSVLTDYENRLIRSFMTHANVSIQRDYPQKIVFLLASIESILLRDSNESIGQNLRERLAVVLGQTLDERHQIMADARTLYDLRSAFFHHAEEIRDIEAIERFMAHVWRFLIRLLHENGKWDTMDAFIKSIDDQKMSP